MSDNALRAKIQLDGAEDVARQLKSIGQSGREAFAQAGQAARQAGQSLGAVQSALQGLFSGFQQTAQSFLGAGSALGKAFDPLVKAAGSAKEAATETGAGLGAIAAAASGVTGAIGTIGQAAANSISKLNDAAEAVGLTLEKFRQLQAGAQSIGLPANSLTSASQAADDLAGKISSALDLGLDMATALGEKYRQLQNLGVEVIDSFGKAREGSDIIRDVIAALSKMEDETEKTKAAVAIFGESVGKALVQASNHVEDLNKTISTIQLAGAAFSEAQMAMIQEARRSGVELEAVKQSWKDYFEALAAPVAIEQNHAILDFLAENAGAIKDFGDNVVGPAIVWLGKFQNAFGAAAIAAGALGSAIGLLSPLTAAVFGASGLAAIAFGDDIKNGAVAAMVELTRIVKSNDLSTFAGWKNAAAQVWADIKQVAVDAFESIKQQILSTDWGAVWENVKAGAVSAYQAIKAAALETFPALTEPWNVAESIVTGAITAISEAFKIVLGVADQVAKVINAAFGTHFTGATLLATAVVAKFAESLIPIPGWVRAIAAVLAPFAAAFNTLIIAARGAVGAIDVILGKFQQLLDAIEGKFWEGLRELVGPELWDSLKSQAEAALGAVSSRLASVADEANKMLASIMNGAAFSPENLNATWEMVKGAAQAAWDAIKNGAQAAWNAIKAGAEPFFSWLDAKWNALKDLGGSIWDKFKDGANSAWEAVKAAFTGSLAWIESKWTALISKIKAGLTAIGLGGGNAASQEAASSSSNSDNSGASSGYTSAQPAPASSSSDNSASSSVGMTAGGGIFGFASGGVITGPGSGTSDSILARLSNGEHVTPAASTSFWGAPIMEAIRTADFPGLLKALQFPGFANGGAADDEAGPGSGNPLFAAFNQLRQAFFDPGRATNFAAFRETFAQVQNALAPGNFSPIGALAGGGLLDLSGLAPAVAPFTLPKAANSDAGQPSRAGPVSFALDLGGQRYELHGDRDTVAELQRHAALRQISSTTKRAPGWNR